MSDDTKPEVTPAATNGPVRTLLKPSGDLLKDVNDMFKALMGREPTLEELEQSKEWMRQKELLQDEA